ncbi:MULTISPECIES: eCIS core domain-containing protein [unclassified Streptomyces]|uniref:eCIS core domain-containing protein n=1 Tax=Streptomyces sp. NPDC127129 TaxID=3345373 RepID=UPI00363785C6
MYDRASSRAAKKRDASADRTSAARAVAPAESLLDLQRSAGNAAVVQMLRRAGAAQDEHRHGAGCGHEQEPGPSVQRSSVHSVLRRGGRPLDAESRSDMEARFGADFSDVRIHTDSAAQASATELGASAYTSGSHIVAGPGGMDRHTLAHELTHVLQQRKGPVAGTDRGDGLRVSDPSDRFEREAEATAHRVLRSSATEAAGEATADAAPAAGGTGDVQRMHHPGKIDGEVARLVAQAEPGLDEYLAEYSTWLAKKNNMNWVMMNADLNDNIAYLENLVGPPAGRSRAELLAALESSIRADLTSAASDTVSTTQAAALAAKRKLVLGRTGDTGQWATYQQGKAPGGDRLSEGARMGRRLNTAKWSVPVNYAFMDGGIAERAVFKILTSLGAQIEGMLIAGQLHAGNFWNEVEALGDGALWDSNKAADEGGPQAMLGHEILQLLESGYQFFGRESTYAQGARLVAIHPDRPAPAPGDKTQPITLP